MATNNTTGTNTAATLSTKACTGALLACAASTAATMWANTLWADTTPTRTNTVPLPLIEPPNTRSPKVLSWGMDSPVIIDSSACVSPSSMKPSTGKRSPGKTRITSSGKSSSGETSISSKRSTWLGMRCATVGRSAVSARMASPVWRLALPSQYLPSNTMLITMADASKYKWG